jgi:hypothetical protein
VDTAAGLVVALIADVAGVSCVHDTVVGEDLMDSLVVVVVAAVAVVAVAVDLLVINDEPQILNLPRCRN